MRYCNYNKAIFRPGVRLCLEEEVVYCKYRKEIHLKKGWTNTNFVEDELKFKSMK